MSMEQVTEASLLNDDQNLSSVSERPENKKKTCIILTIVGVAVACIIILTVGLSVGLTQKKTRSTASSMPQFQKIAFIAAMEEELSALLDAFPPGKDTELVNIIENKVNISIIKYKNLTIIAALSGVGKVNAAYTTAIILVKYDPDVVINVGVAGGFDKSQKILDFAIATSFVYTDVDITNLNFPPGQIQGEPLYFPAYDKVQNLIKPLESDMNDLFVKEFPDSPVKNINFFYGLLGSGDQFIYSNEQTVNIQSKFKDVICVEMEGCSIAHVCYKFEKPLISIRSLSDIAVSEDDNTDNYTNSFVDASKSAALLSILLIENIAQQ